MGLSTFPAPAAGLVKYSQLFTSSGTFTLPSGYSSTNPLFVDVVVVGGGGGGGAGAQNYYGGGGGGSGCGFYYQQIPVYANTTVTIGTGGTGGTVGSVNNGNDGTNGGSSFFGDLQAPGGGFGQGSKQTATTNYGDSLWTGTQYNSSVFLTHSYKNQNITDTRWGGCGGSAGAKGQSGSSTVNSAGIFGGLPTETTLTGNSGTNQFNTYYASPTPLSQGALDGGIGYNNSVTGFIFTNPSEGLNISVTYPGDTTTYSNATVVYGYIGKKWWLPGGGGGGVAATNGGGTAGTKTTAGKNGSAGAGTGASATAGSGGGGGGGAGGAGGNNVGGAGGSGYVLVSYYA
jgi:hypothetical protein